MQKKFVIQKTFELVKGKFLNEGSGHDYFHILRVWQLSKKIAKVEGGDLFIIELGALLHDIADWKFNNNDLDAGKKASREWLEQMGVEEEIVGQVCHIVENISYKGAGAENKIKSLEGKIVQDADRLDAIGAIGIARSFAYAGFKGIVLYDPNKKPVLHKNFEEYKDGSTTAINHFYEKLLLLADRMNTKTARQIALKRDKFMREFLEKFLDEWNGIS